MLLAERVLYRSRVYKETYIEPARVSQGDKTVKLKISHNNAKHLHSQWFLGKIITSILQFINN